MMRYLLLSLLGSMLFLFANEPDTCYTVQIKSFIIKDEGAYRFEGYPPSCRLIKDEMMHSVRCGCFSGYSQAKAHQEELRSQYPDSLISRIYKKRFEHENGETGKSGDDQELRLLFQVFSYSSDVENAYKTAREALKRYPHSIYWHEKMAEVCIWTDRREEAVEHMMYVYRHTHDIKLQEKIFSYSLSAYQYTTAALIIEQKVKKDPSRENVEQLVYIFDLVGKPLESAEILQEVYEKDPSRKYLLTQQLQIYLNTGELARAAETVKRIENEKLRDMRTSFLLSHYYFLRQEIQASYNALIAADLNSSDANATQYYMQLSDLSWYVREYQGAAEASIMVDEAEQARLVDYERIMAVYRKQDPQRALKASRDAYMKFSQPYLFYTYAYMATEKKAYAELLDVCERIEADDQNILPNEALYWMIKAQAHAGLHQNDEAVGAFTTALKISPQKAQIIESYLWFLMDTNQQKHLHELLMGLEESLSSDPQLWLPMAVAYFSIQNADRAAYYLDKLERHGKSDREIRLLNAYVKQSQDQQEDFLKRMNALHRELQSELRDNPRLREDADFMQTYLSVSMFFTGADRFEEELTAAHNILPENVYSELSLSFALRENVDEQVHHLASAMIKPEPWIRLNLALTFDDRTSQQDLLYDFYRTLPLGDALAAAQNTGQISLAQSVVFEGLEKNEKSVNLYDQMRQLHNEYADYFLINGGYLYRTGLSQAYADLHNSYYLAKGYSFEADAFVASNAINDDEVFRSLPSTSTAFGLGIKKRFDRGFYQLDAGIKKSAAQYSYLSFHYSTLVSRRIEMELFIDKGARAEESVYLLVGGYKDRVGLQTRYALLESSRIGFYLEGAEYASDDGADLGSGISGRLDYTYLQRSAYPDISITPYYTFGDYTQSGGDRGVIEDMLNFPDTNVLSDDFWYAGVDLSYGMENRYNYVRVWRPFFSVSPYYNGRESQYNYGFSAGIGGELFGQDNLSLIAEYSESVGGTSDTLWRTSFRYKILY